MKDKRNRYGAVGKLSSEQHFCKCAAITQTSQLGSRPGRENASSYFHAAVKPCRAHAHTIF